MSDGLRNQAYLTIPSMSGDGGDDASEKPTWRVLAYTADDVLSDAFVYHIDVIRMPNDVQDITQFIAQPAQLSYQLNDSVKPFVVYGMIESVEEVGQSAKAVRYAIKLTSSLRKLCYTVKTMTFLDKSIPQIIQEKLRDVKDIRFQWRLTEQYEPHEYVCQFQESDWHFIHRWLAYYGIYYRCVHDQGGEVIEFIDNAVAHQHNPTVSTLSYYQGTGELPFQNQLASRIDVKTQQVVRDLKLESYNYHMALAPINASAVVSDRGSGEVTLYDEHSLTQELADRIATIRAQEMRYPERVFQIECVAQGLMPGELVALTNYGIEAYNTEYVVLRSHYHVLQADSLAIPDLGHGRIDLENERPYRQVLELIESHVQFRPERRYRPKKIDGIVLGNVDASGGQQFPHIDEEGRYRIKLTHGQESAGLNSCWVRKSHYYMGNMDGSAYGEHEPLHNGTEVALIFVQGNPDFPMIYSALYNSSQPNIINEDNRTLTRNSDSAGNITVTNFESGQEHLTYFTPTPKTTVSLGNVHAGLRDTHRNASTQNEYGGNEGVTHYGVGGTGDSPNAAPGGGQGANAGHYQGWAIGNGIYFHTMGDLAEKMNNRYIQVNGASRSVTMGLSFRATLGGSISGTFAPMIASNTLAVMSIGLHNAFIAYSSSWSLLDLHSTGSTYSKEGPSISYEAIKEIQFTGFEVSLWSCLPKALLDETNESVGAAEDMSTGATITAAVAEATQEAAADKAADEASLPVHRIKLTDTFISIQTSPLEGKETPGAILTNESLMVATMPLSFEASGSTIYMTEPQMTLSCTCDSFISLQAAMIAMLSPTITINAEEVNMTGVEMNESFASKTTDAEEIETDTVMETLEAGDENIDASSVSSQAGLSSDDGGEKSVNTGNEMVI